MRGKLEWISPCLQKLLYVSNYLKLPDFITEGSYLLVTFVLLLEIVLSLFNKKHNREIPTNV